MCSFWYDCTCCGQRENVVLLPHPCLSRIQSAFVCLWAVALPFGFVSCFKLTRLSCAFAHHQVSWPRQYQNHIQEMCLMVWPLASRCVSMKNVPTSVVSERVGCCGLPQYTRCSGKQQIVAIISDCETQPLESTWWSSFRRLLSVLMALVLLGTRFWSLQTPTHRIRFKVTYAAFNGGVVGHKSK
jgi:hypothetical protein